VRIVCDTNVLVSGILFGGLSRQILLLASRGKITNYISDDILHEAKNVLLRPKFKLTPQQVIAIIALFRDTFELVYPTRQHKVVQSDPDDDRILDAAVEAQVEIIISGDKHLRSLGLWQGIRILSPAEFVKEIEGEQSRRL
jgi:putative PIN family toxin of toxin-antitoxin system